MSGVKVRLRLPDLNAIQWTAENDREVHEFIRRHGYTTRYMSGASDAMYLHAREGWLAAKWGESSVRRWEWIVQGIAGQPGLRVVAPDQFPFEYAVCVDAA
jgi:hypothetical protein